MKKNGATKIFVNLSVKNLDKSKSFYSKLGYRFNKQFTDKKAACMVISEDIYVMLITNKFFKTFTKKKIVDPKSSTEAIIAISTDSRKKVDELFNNAIKAGGKESRKPDDYGWMYSRSFQDVDGHLWEIMWMDENHVKKN